MSDFYEVLGSGLNLQPPPIVQLQAISIGHGNRLRKIEKNIVALIRRQAKAAAMARVKVESKRACRLFFRPMARAGDELKHDAWSYSVHEIALSHGQDFCRLAGKKAAIGPHFVGFRVDLHARRGVIQNHGVLADFACVGDRKKFFCEAERLTFSSSAWLTNVTELSVKERPNAPNIGR